MADASASLSPFGDKPLIDEIEVVAAVVDLAVTVACGLPSSDDRHGFLAAVPHPRQRLCQMYGGIRVMSNTKQQDLPVEVVDAPDRTVRAMGHVQRMIGRDPSGFPSERGKSVRAITAQDVRRSLERVRHHSHSEAARTSRIERIIVVIGHAGHHQSAVRPKGGLKRADQARWPALNRTHP